MTERDHINTATFEELIEKDGKLVYTCKGFSMMPMLRQHRDLVIISKITQPLKKYDVILFKRNGRYILHRIVAVKENTYDTAGDHNWWKEYDIRKDEIIGVLTAFVRDGKEIRTDDPKYMAYVHAWQGLSPLRSSLLKSKSAVRKSVKKLTGK